MSPLRAILFLSISAVSCTSDVEPLTPAQRQAVAAYVSDERPAPAHELDAEFDRRVRLIGYELDRAEWKPGDTMRVTWYWETIAPPRDASRLLTQIESPEGKRVLNQDGNGTLRWLYGPEHWRAGQFVRDVQELHLPADWSASSASVRVGLQVGTQTSEAVLAFTLPTPVAGPAKVAPVPELAVVQTSTPPRLDGSLEDAAWGFANSTGPFVETIHGGRAAVEASAKLLWDKRYLYVAVDVRDSLLRASDTERDSHLWEQDCVELMIDPDGDGKDYFEIQVSPRGVVFDTRYDRRRIPKPYGRVAWDSRARASAMARGSIDDAEADAGYTVEIAIPWQAFSPGSGSFEGPSPGDRWRLNLYVMDLGRDRQRAAAWSPLGIGDFHVPHRFGILRFEGTPEAMQGKNAPIEMPEGRMPGPMRRRGVDPGAKDALIQNRDRQRRQMPALPTSPDEGDLQRLESSGDGH